MAARYTPLNAGSTRVARSRPWTAVLVALGVVVLGFMALMVLQLGQFWDASSPLVVVADTDGSRGPQIVILTAKQVEADGGQTVTIRLRNDSLTAQSVTAALSGGPAEVSGTLTAALTLEGSVVTSAPLSALTLPAFTLAPAATTPLSLELHLDADQVGALFDNGNGLTLTVGTLS
jgi:hypothetical protein